jgi:DNA gyrase/topoisomerase IV subunit A
MINDLSTGRFDVAIDIGPSFLTRRLESSQAMTEFATAIPAAGQFMADLIAQNSDWPGAQAIAKRLKRALLPPEMQEGEGESNIPPEAQAQIDQLTQVTQQTQQQLQLAMQELQKLSSELETTKLEKERKDLENQRLKAQGELERERAAFTDDKTAHAEEQAGQGRVESLFKEQAQRDSQIAEAMQANTAVLQSLVKAVAGARQPPKG